MALTAVQKAYCDNLLELNKKAIAIQKKIDDIRAAIAKIRQFKLGAALKSVADNVGAELTAIAGQLASQIVSSAAGAISGAMAAILQMVFKQILRILLAGPTAIFSMINMPLDKAKKHTQREKVKLLSAKGHMTVCVKIISKWLSGFGGEKYVKQMKDAMPYIEKTVSGIQSILNELNVPEGQTPYFNSTAYNNVLLNLRNAVDITEPKSSVLEKLDFQTNIEADQDEEINRYLDDPAYGLDIGIGSISMNDYRDQKKLDYAKEYTDRISSINASRNPSNVSSWNVVASTQENLKRIASEADISFAKSKYKLQIEGLDNWYEINKQIVINRVKFTRVDVIGRSVIRSKDRLAAEFSADYNELTKNLKAMRSDIIDAFADYKQSQLFTGITYGALDRLQALMQFFIDAAAYGAFGSVQVAVTALEQSQEVILDTRDTFSSDISNASSGELLAAKASLDVAIGNIELKTADAIMRATLVKNLTDSINLKKALENESVKFDLFRGEVESIPDFNGQLNKWGVNDPASLADVGKYMSLLGSIVKLAASAPSMITGGNRMMSQVKEVNRTFDEMISHNSKVENALYSYTPYQNEMTNELKTMLDSMGLEFFALAVMALSITDMLNQMRKNFMMNQACEDDPEYQAKVAALDNAYEIQAETTRKNLEASMRNNLAAMEEMLERTKDFFKRKLDMDKAKKVAEQKLKTTPPQDPGLEPNNSATTREAQAAYYSSAT